MPPRRSRTDRLLLLGHPSHLILQRYLTVWRHPLMNLCAQCQMHVHGVPSGLIIVHILLGGGDDLRLGNKTKICCQKIQDILIYLIFIYIIFIFIQYFRIFNLPNKSCWVRRVNIRGFQEERSSTNRKSVRTCQLEGRRHLRGMSPMNPRSKARHYPIPRGPWCPTISPEAAAGIRILLQSIFCSSRIYIHIHIDISYPYHSHIHPGYQRTEPRCHDSARSAGSSTKDGNRQYRRAQRRFELSCKTLVC